MNDAESQTILFTNLFMIARTGSELHILELAKHFVENGWEATIYTLTYGYPLQKELESIGAKVVTFGNENELSDHYDVLYAQHRRVSEFLATQSSITFDRVIVSVLGVVTSEEALPFFTPNADAVVFVSNEAKAFYAADNRLTGKQMLVLPNTASTDFFAPASRKFEGIKFPRRTVIISNHVAKELKDFADIVRAREANSSVDVYGYETTSVEISPELLSQYDLVISIGRTAQLAFASGTPYYCYDAFGGPGFISENDISKHAYFNFSGRSEPTQRTGEELYRDIVNRYETAVEEVASLRHFAVSQFMFDKEILKLDNLICSIPHNTRSLAENTTSDQRELCEMRCREFQQIDRCHYGVAQVFYTNDPNNNMPTEERSFKFQYRYQSKISVRAADFNNTEAKFIRFDPDEAPCVCAFDSNSVTTHNAAANLDGNYHFISFDPMLYLKHGLNKITFTSKRMDVNSANQLQHHLEKQLKRQSERQEMTQAPFDRINVNAFKLIAKKLFSRNDS